jgi:hypothetical protein
VVDLADNIRAGQHQQVIVSFKIALPVGKTLTAKIGLVQLITLDHGAHAAIKQHDTFRQLLLQCFNSVAHSRPFNVYPLATRPAEHTGTTFERVKEIDGETFSGKAPTPPTSKAHVALLTNKTKMISTW